MLQFSTTDDSAIRLRVQQIIRQQLRDVGIEIEIVNFPRRVFFPDIVQARKFTGMVMFAFGWGPESDCDQYYTSDALRIETPASGRIFGLNYSGYRNEEMDKVCKGAAQELDPEARNRLLRASAQLFARDLPALPLYYRTEVAVAKVGLQNFAPRGLGNETWNGHTWYWK